MLNTQVLNNLRAKCTNEKQFNDILAILDITETREDKTEIYNKDHAFYRIFRSSPDAMIISSLDTGLYIDVNESFARHTGYERHELIGRSSLELSVWVKASDRDEFIDLLRQDGYVSNFEAPYQKKDGSIGIGLVSSQFITLNNEDCLISVTRDITHYKETTRQLMLADERASIYYEFLTNASHELRTPISVINTSLYIAGKTESDAKRKESCERITQQTELLNQMIDNLLLLARIDLITELNQTLVEPEELIDNVAMMLAIRAQQQDITVHKSIADKTPLIQVETEYFAVALFQVLKNAIEFSNPGDTVEIKTYMRDTDLIIEVRDNGQGIEDNILPHIFDRFYRGDSARTTRGLGLGLSMASKIADYHGCSLQVETSKGVGTSFHFVIPAYSQSHQGLSTKNLASYI